MNRRYRRQMMLRSRAHRRGEPIGCQCHRRTWVIDAGNDVEITICEPSWKPPVTQRRIRTLPDISAFMTNLATFKEAAVELGEITECVTDSLKEMARRFDAEPD